MSVPGTISAPHHLATAAGTTILDRGGSAVDAAIAASAVLCVVYPHMVTLGGDSWSLVGDAGGSVRAIDGTGRAPRALSAAFLRDQGYESVPGDGPHASTTPGGVAAWGLLHRDHGRLPFGELLADAIDLAQNGVAVAPSLERDIVMMREALQADPGCRDLFFSPDGRPKNRGDRLVQPALARTLRALAERGADELYRGELGRAYVAGLRERGSLIEPADLADHHARYAEPIGVSYAGAEVLTAPPNSQGFVLLQILSAARLAAGERWFEDDSLRWLPDAVRAFGDDRDTRLADPDRMTVTAASLISDEHIRETLAGLGAGGRAHRQPPLGGDTCAIVAMDDRGQSVSLIQSVAGSFGSKVLEPATGILNNNRGAAFSLVEGSSGLLVGGTKPPHTLAPVLVRRNGSVFAAVGTMGGKNQPAILAQVIGRLLAGANAQEAVDAPRWVVRAPSGEAGAALQIEDGTTDRIVALLREGSLPVLRLAATDNQLGQSQVVIARAGGFERGTDRRADGALRPS